VKSRAKSRISSTARCGRGTGTGQGPSQDKGSIHRGWSGGRLDEEKQNRNAIITSGQGFRGPLDSGGIKDAVFWWLLIGFGFLLRGANGRMVCADHDMPLSIPAPARFATGDAGKE
jgi:hypothetical protein